MVGVNEYTFSAPAVAKPQVFGLQRPAPTSVALVEVPHASVVITLQGSTAPEQLLTVGPVAVITQVVGCALNSISNELL